MAYIKEQLSYMGRLQCFAKLSWPSVMVSTGEGMVPAVVCVPARYGVSLEQSLMEFWVL